MTENKKILIVEDESIIALNIRETLLKKNFAPLEICTSGQAAIDSSKKNIPDLILMDINLSGKLDGIETYKIIKKNLNIPVIYITAFSSDKTIERAKLTAPHGYITKPINNSELITAIEISLYKFSMEQQLQKKNQQLEETIKILEKANYECEIKNKQITHTQQELIDKDNQFRLIFENSRDAIRLSKNRIHIMVNNAYLKLFGYTNENEIVGQPINITNSNNQDSPLKKYLSQSENQNLDHYHMIGKRKDGSDFLAEINISSYKTSQGTFQLSIIRDITNQKIEAEKNQRIMQKMALHVEQTPLGVIEWDTNWRVTAWNKAAHKIFKYTPKEAIGKHARELILSENDSKHPEKIWKKLLANKGGKRSTDTNTTKYGKKLVCEWYNTPLIDKTGKVIGITSLVQDITDRVETEDKIKISLHEKEALLKEIHHRVKNNMQVITSLINLQIKQIKDPFDKMLLQETENRIRSIALVHDKLYKSKNLGKINFQDYVTTFTNDIAKSHSNNIEKIKIDINIANIFLDIEIAIPCALIINELVANSFRHAFDEKSTGFIAVDFNQHTKGTYILSIADNGKGIPQELDIYKKNTLGLQLVQALTMQLGGHLDINQGKGTKFRITFPQN